MTFWKLSEAMIRCILRWKDRLPVVYLFCMIFKKTYKIIRKMERRKKERKNLGKIPPAAREGRSDI